MSNPKVCHWHNFHSGDLKFVDNATVTIYINTPIFASEKCKMFKFSCAAIPLNSKKRQVDGDHVSALGSWWIIWVGRSKHFPHLSPGTSGIYNVNAHKPKYCREFFIMELLRYLSTSCDVGRQTWTLMTHSIDSERQKDKRWVEILFCLIWNISYYLYDGNSVLSIYIFRPNCKNIQKIF